MLRVVASAGGAACRERFFAAANAAHETRGICATCVVPEYEHETAFEMATSNVRYGPGVTKEVGADLREWGVRNVMVLTDANLAQLPAMQVVTDSLRSNGIHYQVYDRVRVEPTDQSFKDAIRFATDGGFDSFVALGGGSTMDTAKAANLYSTYPPEDDFLDYVNAPVGKGTPVPGPLKPLIAIPTTAGTGSETTGVAIFDLVAARSKTGIGHRYMKPRLALVDPDNLASVPDRVAVAAGLDVFSHCIESFTAVPYTTRPRAASPNARPAYQGSNPISDVWSVTAFDLCVKYLPRFVADRSDTEARENLILAATYAGVGFGNAGVHAPHGLSYAVASQCPSSFHLEGYRPGLCPHGVSVIVHAPAVFRFTGDTRDPDQLRRHRIAAAALAQDKARSDAIADADVGAFLADQVTEFIKKLGVPDGLSAIGFTSDDVPALVKGALPQDRVLKLCPKPLGEQELAQLYHDSMTLY